MGITYTGRFSTISGLRHAAPSQAVSSALTPATSWIGSAKVATANGDFYAVSYQNHVANDGFNETRFTGCIDIYQTDAAGTIVSKVITFAPGSVQNMIPGFIEFSPNGKYLAASFNKVGDATNSGIYIFERTDEATWEQVRVLQGGRNNFSWHINSTTYFWQTTGTHYVGDILLPGQYTFPIGIDAIRGNVQTQYGTAWFGNSLLIPVIDNYDGGNLRWQVWEKGFLSDDLVMAPVSLSLNLNSGLPEGLYSRIYKLSDSRFALLYSTNQPNVPLIRDFNNFGGEISPRPLSPALPQAQNYAFNFVTYSPNKQRLLFGNSAATYLLKDISGVLTYIPSEVFKARKNPVAATHHISGDVIFSDNYDVTTYSLPSSGGFKNPPTHQTANSLVFSWDMNQTAGSTDFTPTISGSFNSNPVTKIGSPVFAAAPSKSGETALRFPTAGADKIVMAKDRDWQFMYDGFTIEMYLYFTGKTDGALVFGDSKIFWLTGVTSGSSNQFRFRFGNGNFETVNINNVSAGAWHHIAVTGSSNHNEEYSTMTLKTYTDGYPGNTTLYKFGGQNLIPLFPNHLNYGYLSMGGSIDPTTGGQPVSNNGFAGYLRGVRVWNYAKTYTGIPFTLPTF